MELRIDQEFAEKIPPLTKEEFEQLEANILADGVVINPLIVWNGVIVDGHNRYRIIQMHPEADIMAADTSGTIQEALASDIPVLASFETGDEACKVGLFVRGQRGSDRVGLVAEAFDDRLDLLYGLPGHAAPVINDPVNGRSGYSRLAGDVKYGRDCFFHIAKVGIIFAFFQK